MTSRIETKVFTKSEPIYLHPSSCHVPSVFKGLYKSIGQRLRLNCSRDADFEEAVEKYSKAFAVSGHNYQRAKAELMKCKNMNRLSLLNDQQRKINQGKGRKKNGKKIFWISLFGPRVMHPRKIISRNYHHPHLNLEPNLSTFWILLLHQMDLQVPLQQLSEMKFKFVISHCMMMNIKC